MAHFCKFCGTKLEDGEVCTCQASKIAAQEQAQNQAPVQPAPQFTQAPQQPVQQPQPQYIPPQQPQQFAQQQMPQQQYVPQQQYAPQYGYAPQPQTPSAFSRWMNNVKLFIKSPADVARNAVRNRQFKSGLIFMGIAAVLMGFINLIVAAKINGFFAALSSMMSLLGGGSDAKINLAGAFFSQAIICFGFLCLFALFVMLFAKVFKCSMSYTHALAATGMASIVAVPFILLALISTACISSFISAGIIFMGIFLLDAIIAGLFITIEAIKDDKYLTNNNAVYVVFIALAATLACLLIFNYIINYKSISSLKDAMSGLSSLGSLSKLF